MLFVISLTLKNQFMMVVTKNIVCELSSVGRKREMFLVNDKIVGLLKQG